MISDFISWCGNNYWWFVLGNFVLMFGLPLLLGLFTKDREGLEQYGQYPGCIIALGSLQCLLGPILYVFAALGLIIMIISYSSDLIKKIYGRRS
jgi:hypothetical protein